MRDLCCTKAAKLKVKLIAPIKHIFYFGAFQDIVFICYIYIFFKRKCISAKVEDTLLTTVHSFMTLI